MGFKLVAFVFLLGTFPERFQQRRGDVPTMTRGVPLRRVAQTSTAYTLRGAPDKSERHPWRSSSILVGTSTPS
jgi:hypothetical protein